MSSGPAQQPLGPDFERALLFACEAHRTQLRKGSTVPYISHLMAVARLVLEYGGDEQQAIAALLHDAPEDQGGAAMLERIRNEFGDDVAALVNDCTEILERSRLDWSSRKKAYLAHLSSITDRAALIAGCDKVHNARNLITALELCGPSAFERFNGKAAGTKWWYQQLATQLGPRLPVALQRELDRLTLRAAEF